MPQPTLSQVHINRPLTTISTAYIQDRKDFIFADVFPAVPVDKKTDLYWIYTKNDWFRDEAAPRAPGAESAGSGYDMQTASYDCTVYAFHKDVPDQVRENTDAPLQPDRDATMFCTQRLLLRQERQWAANYFKTGVWGTDYTPTYKWSDYTSSDPITDIETGKDTIQSTTGFFPNRMVLGYTAFRYLKQHPDIIDRTKYTTSKVPTEELLAELFGIEKVIVAKAVVATNNEGGTPVYSRVHGNNALLAYSAPAPSLLQPSAGYTFYWRGVSRGLGTNVAIKDFYMQWLESTRVEGEVAFDQHVVGADLGYFINGAA